MRETRGKNEGLERTSSDTRPGFGIQQKVGGKTINEEKWPGWTQKGKGRANRWSRRGVENIAWWSSEADSEKLKTGVIPMKNSKN